MISNIYRIDQANQLHDNVLKGRTEDVEDTLSAYENACVCFQKLID